ncbi:MAG TPA: hypothetical protein VIH71_04685 [Solirubrobacteraceae bacterium]
MTTSITVPITLTLAERHTLSDLIEGFLHDRGWEGVRAARYSMDIEAAAAKLLRLAALKALVEGEHHLPPDIDVAALRSELAAWWQERVATVDEHDAQIAETPAGVTDGIAELWQQSAVDYAHQRVCERIIGQIDAACGAVAV